jgi:hypothetical protein
MEFLRIRIESLNPNLVPDSLYILEQNLVPTPAARLTLLALGVAGNALHASKDRTGVE